LSDTLTISIDAMGGDHGPAVTVRAALLAIERLPGVSFLLHGDRNLIEEELVRAKAEQRALIEIRHSDRAIAMDEKPAQAMRRGKGTSL